MGKSTFTLTIYQTGVKFIKPLGIKADIADQALGGYENQQGNIIMSQRVIRNSGLVGVSAISETEFADKANGLSADNLTMLISLINTASLLHHIHCSENEILDALGQILVAGIQEPPLRIDVVRGSNLRVRDNQKVA